jgi:hypothetical protein
LPRARGRAEHFPGGGGIYDAPVTRAAADLVVEVHDEVARLYAVRSVALACLLALPACGGAPGYTAFLILDGSTDDGSANDAGSDGGEGDDAGGAGGCVASSCTGCRLGTPSCSDAGACQCCEFGLCLPP